MGPNCLATSRAALALQASQPQAGVRSCLTSTLSINESHASCSASPAEPSGAAGEGALSGRAAHAGHANHTTHACVLSQSLEQTRKVAALATHLFCSSLFVISSLLQRKLVCPQQGSASAWHNGKAGHAKLQPTTTGYYHTSALWRHHARSLYPWVILATKDRRSLPLLLLLLAERDTSKSSQLLLVPRLLR
jgi:hypothetical protein